MAGEIFNVITALGAIGSFIGAIIALTKVVKLTGEIKFKPEKLYGKEAQERYNIMRSKIHEISPNAFGLDEYKGGTRAIPQFEVERFYFDADTMDEKWKKCAKTVRYYYEEDGKTLVRGWRL